MTPESRSSRQSFLGEDSDEALGQARVAIVGCGGGGSHVAQQLAHVGFRRFVLYDGDSIEESNLNRMVGGNELDVAMSMPKVIIAERVIRGIARNAEVERFPTRWQENPGPLQSADLVVGCVDGYRERWELQVCARRFVLPYIDIGLDVISIKGAAPKMRGQVILSMPGGPCLRCVHFIDDENLDREGQRYGDAGPRPQVVWANGVLASTAVGLAVELLTNWIAESNPLGVVYLAYDGNLGTVTPDKRLKFVTANECSHFTDADLGEPTWRAV